MRRIRLFAIATCLFALWQFPSVSMAAHDDGLQCAGPDCAAQRMPVGPHKILIARPGETGEPPTNWLYRLTHPFNGKFRLRR